MPSQGKQPSPYLRRSPFLSGTHSQGDMCSCNSPGCFCISRCHKAAGLPSTRQCLQAVSRRQEGDMVTGTSHEPPTLYFYWFCPSLFSLTQYFYATLEQTHSVLLSGYLLLILVETSGDLLKSLENVSDLVRAQSLFFNYLPPLPKSDYARFIFTFKALIKYNRWLNSFASKLTHNKNTVFFIFFY